MYDLFHIVFVVALLSVTFQGAFLLYLAKKFDMIDRYSDVRKTFNDFQQESAIALNKIIIKNSHPWQNCKVKDLTLSDNALILYIKRNNDKIVPNGETQIKENDEILIGTTVANIKDEINLCETNIDNDHEWLNKR